MVIQVSKLQTVAPLMSWWCCGETPKLSPCHVLPASETVASNPNRAHGDPSLQVANRRALDVQVVVLRRDNEVEPLPRLSASKTVNSNLQTLNCLSKHRTHNVDNIHTQGALMGRCTMDRKADPSNISHTHPLAIHTLHIDTKVRLGYYVNYQCGPLS